MVNLCIVIVEPSWVENLNTEEDDVVFLWARDRPFPVKPGEIIAFKLRDHRDICGCAIVRRCLREDIDTVWDRYGATAGVNSRIELMGLVTGMRRYDVIGASTEMGVMVLGQPAFFKPERRPQLPSSWRPSTAISRRFSTDNDEGLGLWRSLAEGGSFAGPRDNSGFSESSIRYGPPIILFPRVGQREFSHNVGEAYGYRCVVTGERAAVQAAHIKPFAQDGAHKISNGIVLRCDIHRLLDLGYVTISEDFKLIVSNHTKKKYGEIDCIRYHGKPIRDPLRPTDRPDLEMIRWHHVNVFEKFLHFAASPTNFQKSKTILS